MQKSLADAQKNITRLSDELSTASADLSKTRKDLINSGSAHNATKEELESERQKLELIRVELTKSGKDLNETREKLEDSEELRGRVSIKVSELQDDFRSKSEELMTCSKDLKTYEEYHGDLLSFF